MKGQVKKSQRITMIVLMVLVLTLCMSTLALAGSDPGVALGNWLQRNVAGLFVGIVAIVAIFLFVKRQMMAAIIVIVFAGLAAVLIYGGAEFAQKIADIIKSWF